MFPSPLLIYDPFVRNLVNKVENFTFEILSVLTSKGKETGRKRHSKSRSLCMVCRRTLLGKKLGGLTHRIMSICAMIACMIQGKCTCISCGRFRVQSIELQIGKIKQEILVLSFTAFLGCFKP
jgi:hypothetical protein